MGAEVLQAGIADDDVDVVDLELLEGTLNDMLPEIGVTDVGLDCGGLDAGINGQNFRKDGICGSCGREVCDGDVCASLTGEEEGRLFTNPPTTSRHDSDLSI